MVSNPTEKHQSPSSPTAAIWREGCCTGIHFHTGLGVVGRTKFWGLDSTFSPIPPPSFISFLRTPLPSVRALLTAFKRVFQRLEAPHSRSGPLSPTGPWLWPPQGCPEPTSGEEIEEKLVPCLNETNSWRENQTKEAPALPTLGAMIMRMSPSSHGCGSSLVLSQSHGPFSSWPLGNGLRSGQGSGRQRGVSDAAQAMPLGSRGSHVLSQPKVKPKETWSSELYQSLS